MLVATAVMTQSRSSKIAKICMLARTGIGDIRFDLREGGITGWTGWVQPIFEPFDS